MIDTERLKELLNDRKTFWAENDCLDRCHIFEERYEQPVKDALGDNEEEIKAFLLECDEEELLYMSEFFEFIFEKFPNDEMWDFLDGLEIKAGLHD